MKDMSLLRLGGTCALVLGVIKVLTAIDYLILPAALRAEVPAAQFLPAFAQDPSPLLVLFWLETVVGIFGIGLVPALTALVHDAHAGWARWASNLAVVGYAVSAVGYLLSIARLPGIAAAYVAGDASTKAALAAVWKASIDLFGVWGYAAVGFWILVMSILALRNAALPRWLAYLGLLVAVIHLVIPFGAGFKLQPILIAAVVISIVTLPPWYVWVGLVLRRGESTG
jgi:hypothetical protein